MTRPMGTKASGESLDCGDGGRQRPRMVQVQVSGGKTVQFSQGLSEAADLAKARPDERLCLSGRNCSTWNNLRLGRVQRVPRVRERMIVPRGTISECESKFRKRAGQRQKSAVPRSEAHSVKRVFPLRHENR